MGLECVECRGWVCISCCKLVGVGSKRSNNRVAEWGVSELPQSSGLVGQLSAQAARPGVATCDNEPAIEGGGGSMREHPPPIRLPCPGRRPIDLHCEEVRLAL